MTPDEEYDKAWNTTARTFMHTIRDIVTKDAKWRKEMGYSEDKLEAVEQEVKATQRHMDRISKEYLQKKGK